MAKHFSTKAQYDGITFDSTVERDRYLFLKHYAETGMISDLLVHPEYKILPRQVYAATKYSKAKILPQRTYSPDFVYCFDGYIFVEDVKPAWGNSEKSRKANRVGKAIIEPIASLKHAMLQRELLGVGVPFIFVIVTDATYWHEEIPTKPTKKRK
jgi:hypothetical protein